MVCVILWLICVLWTVFDCEFWCFSTGYTNVCAGIIYVLALEYLIFVCMSFVVFEFILIIVLVKVVFCGILVLTFDWLSACSLGD